MDILDREKVFIEMPKTFFGGRGSAESVIKLSFFIGILYGLLKRNEVVFVPVSSWRGSIPKEINWKRAEKFFGQKGFSRDAGDAVAIGHWLIRNKLV